MRYILMVLAFMVTITSVSYPAYAQNLKGDFQTWLSGVRTEALQRGIRPDVVSALLTDVKPNRRVIRRDRSQSEFKLTLSTYMKSFQI